MEREKTQSREAVEGEDLRKQDAVGYRAGEPGLILYLDTSAIVKKYLFEPGSAEIVSAIDYAESIGTAVIARVEVAAAFGKAVRTKLLSEEAAQTCLHTFRKEWTNYYATEISKTLVSRAETYAWNYKLRGYDAVHLAAASVWHDDLGQPVTMGTFDMGLWNACTSVGLLRYPENLPRLLADWRK